MFGWLSRASTRPSRVNRSANAGSAASDCRQNLQGDEAIELRLAGLEDDAHAALADEFEDLQLRKRGRQFLMRWRGRFGRSRPCRPRWAGWPASNRHLGQSPWGASAGIGPPHFGQRFGSDAMLIPLPEASVGKGYTRVNAPGRRKEGMA